ncbi:MAG TPA: alpha/beta hydrolase, partial [Victivallales bacterium]|nr:alpha/beta hydrolase [Victivallales bacterium]
SDRLHSIQVFNKMRCNVLIFDYRGYGRSEGSPSEKGTYLDADAAYDYLMKKGIPEKEIIIFGRSLGGAVAVDLASRNNPSALIIESTFSSIPDMAAKLYPFLPARLLCVIKYDSLMKIEKIKCPLLVVHSPHDEIIPFEMGRKIYEKAKEPKRFLEIIGSHNEGYIDSGNLYEDGILDFISSIERLQKIEP